MQLVRLASQLLLLTQATAQYGLAGVVVDPKAVFTRDLDTLELFSICRDSDRVMSHGGMESGLHQRELAGSCGSARHEVLCRAFCRL